MEKEPKPIHVKPSFYAFCFEALKEIALKYGYNLVLHGSLNRDLDLIAIPWQKELGVKEDMIKEMAAFIGGWVLDETEDARDKYKQAYHGRESFVININRGDKFNNYSDQQYYLDISVTPIVSKAA